jgi:hypothetical protein
MSVDQSGSPTETTTFGLDAPDISWTGPIVPVNDLLNPPAENVTGTAAPGASPGAVASKSVIVMRSLALLQVATNGVLSVSGWP